jgi:hypothetical protein
MMRAFRHRSDVVDWRFTTGIKDARRISAKRELSRLHQPQRLPLTLTPRPGSLTLEPPRTSQLSIRSNLHD